MMGGRQLLQGTASGGHDGGGRRAELRKRGSRKDGCTAEDGHAHVYSLLHTPLPLTVKCDQL